MDYMELSRIILKQRTLDFLKSEKPLGFNKPQYQSDVAEKLDKSMCLIHNILNEAHNLRKEDLYDKFNASTLYPVLELMLRDYRFKYDVKVYDFRTIELARLLFLISTNYLKYSPLFKDSEYAHEDIDRVKERFTELSKSALEKDAFGKFSQRELDNLVKKEYELRKKIDDLKSDPNSEWSNNSREYERLTSLRDNIDRENRDFENTISQLEKQIQDLKKRKNNPQNKLKTQIQEKISKLKERLKENQEMDYDLHVKVLKVQKLRDDSVNQFVKDLSQVRNEKSLQFEHLKKYFCPYPGECLEQFAWYKNAHLPDNDPWQQRGL